jgi:tetratricopeptide (TPR) repeat protein
MATSRPGLSDVQDDLEKAHNAYVAHKYGESEARLRALLFGNPSPLRDPDAVADARMYLGAVLLAEGKKAEAGRTFEQLLLEKPDYQPDALRVSLDAIDSLIDARTRLRVQLAAIQAEQVRKAQEEKAKIAAERELAAARLAMLEKLATTEVVAERHSRLVALLPFGVGQFQNGQTTLGHVFLWGEALLAVGNVTAGSISLYDWAQANDALGRHDGTATQYLANAGTAGTVSYVFGAAFLAAALAGIVHAEVTFVPERIDTRKREILPMVSLEPILGPGTVGVSGRF